MKKKAIILFLLVSICFTLVRSQTSDQLTNEQKTWLSKANRHEKNGWIYLHIEESPEERGFQHGYLLSKEIKESIRILSDVWKYQTAMKWSWYVDRAHDILTPKTDPENLAEIDGMVEGMKVAGDTTSRDEMVSLNGYMELLWYWWPLVKDSIGINAPDPVKQSLKNGKTNVICCSLGRCLRNAIRCQKIS